MSHSGYFNTEWKNMAHRILKFNFTNSYNRKGKIKCVHKSYKLLQERSTNVALSSSTHEFKWKRKQNSGSGKTYGVLETV